MKNVLILLACCVTAALLTSPVSSADSVVASSAAATSAGHPAAPTGAASTVYTHRDCVGPGLPGTAGAHADHTDRVNGIKAGSTVYFSITSIALFGSPGPCPVTAADLGVLPTDFTGTYHVKVVCQGNINPGTVFVDWTLVFIAGQLVNAAAGGNLCYAYVGTTFSLDVSISISSAQFLGLTLPPLGATVLTIQN